MNKLDMDKSIGKQFRELRESTGMSRKAFSDYLHIPYRTMQEWELERRTMPKYVMELIDFKIRHEFQIINANELNTSCEETK